MAGRDRATGAGRSAATSRRSIGTRGLQEPITVVVLVVLLALVAREIVRLLLALSLAPASRRPCPRRPLSCRAPSRRPCWRDTSNQRSARASRTRADDLLDLADRLVRDDLEREPPPSRACTRRAAPSSCPAGARCRSSTCGGARACRCARRRCGAVSLLTGVMMPSSSSSYPQVHGDRVDLGAARDPRASVWCMMRGARSS